MRPVKWEMDTKADIDPEFVEIDGPYARVTSGEDSALFYDIHGIIQALIEVNEAFGLDYPDLSKYGYERSE